MLILASNSPRRKELLAKEITSNFIIIPSTYEEEVDDSLSPLDNVKHLAFEKGNEVFKAHPEAVVISSDTVVVLDNHIFGKPNDKEDAFNMLKKLNGRTHEVITAYCIFSPKTTITNFVVSKVTFNYNDDSLIHEYVNTLSPLDKAGAYGIQDELGSKLISHYEGSLTNIIGFPVDEIKKDLKKVIKIK